MEENHEMVNLPPTWLRDNEDVIDPQRVSNTIDNRAGGMLYHQDTQYANEYQAMFTNLLAQLKTRLVIHCYSYTHVQVYSVDHLRLVPCCAVCFETNVACN